MTSNHGVPRRTILRGAAWSLPVVALAVAAPAAAATAITGAFAVQRSPLGDPILNRALTWLDITANAGSPSAIVTVMLTWNAAELGVDTLPSSNPGWAIVVGSGTVTFTSLTSIAVGSPLTVYFRGTNTKELASQSLTANITAPGYAGTSRTVTYSP